MKPILETDRLRLTPLSLADVDLAVEMFTDPVVTRFIGGVMTEGGIRAGMPLYVRRGGDGCIGIWCISDRITGEKYGDGFLLPIPIDADDTDWDQIVPGIMPDGDVEVGYNLKQDAWGKGYATEVCCRLLRFAFEETPLREVVATLDDDHEASKRVLGKAGLRFKGRRMAYGLDHPDWRITRQEWIAASACEDPRHTSN
jgi:RimJ/RimL family protein N-acetyltransferase